MGLCVSSPGGHAQVQAVAFPFAWQMLGFSLCPRVTRNVGETEDPVVFLHTKWMLLAGLGFLLSQETPTMLPGLELLPCPRYAAPCNPSCLSLPEPSSLDSLAGAGAERSLFHTLQN